jgi:hypothetical protein
MVGRDKRQQDHRCHGAQENTGHAKAAVVAEKVTKYFEHGSGSY